jgi:O-methyltransferase involved in polyketide biosynthesis
MLSMDTVLNPGAGLDTRPYRLKLPSQLNWIEIDFPKIIAGSRRVAEGTR